ncbi:MAG: TlyA family rRNA (cytidine-2'-O)-methyltransferase [Candidatus Latescibacterota bacterium]|nr:MAG: TlyA family rRNA (cytidine-2'-O)-methyltransferase [Candidatus Latescibacterota bacterium]
MQAECVQEMRRFVSRAGEKLEHALEKFEVEVKGKIVADLGSHVGGFVDCLLKHGAAKVYAVEVGKGVLDWKLRNDPRVVVMEGVNALYAELPEKVDLVTIDVGWTRQKFIVPKAASLLKPGGLIISLIKPQYEALPRERRKGVVRRELLNAVVGRTLKGIRALGLEILDLEPSPLPGSGGNREFFVLLRPLAYEGESEA